MREVVIIGAGLSGLVAATILTRHKVPFTIIEVKARVGGSIRSIPRQAFMLDAGPMIYPVEDVDFLRGFLYHFDLADAIVETAQGVIFRRGAGALIDALSRQISAPMMMRMAVSTLGDFDAGRFSICMENGMLLDARGLIVAAPARHAERMFYTLVPQISELLLDYRYDHVARVSVGYEQIDKHDLNLRPPTGSPVTEVQMTDIPERVPVGGVLLQAGVRFEPSQGLPSDIVGELAALMGWPLDVDVDELSYWSESHPVNWQYPEHPGKMKAIEALLPERVSVCGNDYIAGASALALDVRIKVAIQMAEKLLKAL